MCPSGSARPLVVIGLLCASCAAEVNDTRDAASDVLRSDASRADVRPSDVVSDVAPNVDVATAEDNAEIVRVSYPDQLQCSQSGTATVVMRNTGTATWTRAGGYKLAAAGDSDPFHPGDARIWLNDGDSVPPGATHAFDIALTGPVTPRTYTTNWQMVHELVRRFGPSSMHDIAVDCAATTDSGVVPDAGTAVVDLSRAMILNSPPDVASWPETARITTLDLQTSGVYVDFTRRDGTGSWPDVPFGAPGDSLEYTLWIVLNIGGTWYTSGCIEYWRGLDRNGGPPSGYAANWYYDPSRWGAMTGHQPAVGELVGFFVTAGDARNVHDHSGSIVQERSNVVMVPFPSDTGAVFMF